MKLDVYAYVLSANFPYVLMHGRAGHLNVENISCLVLSFTQKFRVVHVWEVSQGCE